MPWGCVRSCPSLRWAGSGTARWWSEPEVVQGPVVPRVCTVVFRPPATWGAMVRLAANGRGKPEAGPGPVVLWVSVVVVGQPAIDETEGCLGPWRLGGRSKPVVSPGPTVSLVSLVVFGPLGIFGTVVGLNATRPGTFMDRGGGCFLSFLPSMRASVTDLRYLMSVFLKHWSLDPGPWSSERLILLCNTGWVRGLRSRPA